MIHWCSDDWMKNNGFTDAAVDNQEAQQFKGATVNDLQLPDAVSVPDSITCAQALDTMSKGGFDQVPVVDASGGLVGLVTVGALLAKTSRAKVTHP